MKKIYLIKLGFSNSKSRLDTELMFEDPRKRDEKFNTLKAHLGEIIDDDTVATKMPLLYALKLEVTVKEDDGGN